LYMIRYTSPRSESNSGLRNSDISRRFWNASSKQKPTAELLTLSEQYFPLLLVTGATLSIVASWLTVSSQSLPFLPNSSLGVGHGQPLPSSIAQVISRSYFRTTVKRKKRRGGVRNLQWPDMLTHLGI
jgi:hypothetical protein